MLGHVTGTAVVNELVLCIVGVHLRRRVVVFEARAHGPIPAGRATSYTLHDEDGAVVARATNVRGMAWEAVGPHDTLVLVLPIAVTGRRAVGLGVDSPDVAAPPVIR